MNGKTSHLDELDDLLSALCAGDLGDRERQRLNDILRCGADERRRFRRYMHLHAAMKWDATTW